MNVGRVVTRRRVGQRQRSDCVIICHERNISSATEVEGEGPAGIGPAR
jgi:hypothetical protein